MNMFIPGPERPAPRTGCVFWIAALAGSVTFFLRILLALVRRS